MKLKIVAVGIILALLAVSFWLAVRHGENRGLEEVVHLKLSKGILQRRADTLTLRSELILPEQTYKACVSGDTLYGIPYESADHAFFGYDLGRKNYFLKSAEGGDASSIAILPDGVLAIQDKAAAMMNFFAGGKLQRSVPLKRKAWRAMPVGNKIIYNAEVNNRSYFYLADGNTGQVQDSVSAAMLFRLKDDEDVGMLTTGYFQRGSSATMASYHVNKAGVIVNFDIQSFQSPQLLFTIDSIGFPRIITEEISPGITRQVPKPDLSVNTSLACLDNRLFVLSTISNSKNSSNHVVDVYDRLTRQYVTSLFLGNRDRRQPKELFMDTHARLLWVLFDDRRTLRSFSIK